MDLYQGTLVKGPTNKTELASNIQGCQNWISLYSKESSLKSIHSLSLKIPQKTGQNSAVLTLLLVLVVQNLGSASLREYTHCNWQLLFLSRTHSKIVEVSLWTEQQKTVWDCHNLILPTTDITNALLAYWTNEFWVEVSSNGPKQHVVQSTSRVHNMVMLVSKTTIHNDFHHTCSSRKGAWPQIMNDQVMKQKSLPPGILTWKNYRHQSKVYPTKVPKSWKIWKVVLGGLQQKCDLIRCCQTIVKVLVNLP